MSWEYIPGIYFFRGEFFFIVVFFFFDALRFVFFLTIWMTCHC